jgi:hypothetical protein
MEFGKRGPEPESSGRWSGIWVRLAVVAAMIWLLVSLVQILDHQASPKGKLDLVGFSVLGAVVIMLLGLLAQWLTEYMANRKDHK